MCGVYCYDYQIYYLFRDKMLTIIPHKVHYHYDVYDRFYLFLVN